MGNLALVEQHRILDLGAVSDYTTITYDHILSYVAPLSQMATCPDDARPHYHSTMFDDGALPDLHSVFVFIVHLPFLDE